MATLGGQISHSPMTAEEKKVIFASSLGTVFEWYDFYLAGSLAAYISKSFFSGVNPTAAFIFTLLGFAAGFAVRPFGAIVFGRLGDLVGRKHTFLVTIVIMGISTFVVGFLPGYTTIGIAAPVIFIAMRLLQGLALGGEYGGAATYVAEHAPANRRGFYTAWIQTTATLGLFLSLLVILGVRTLIGEESFGNWGWRVPFVASILLLAVSVWIRLQLNESPVFLRIKAEGKTSKAPLTEAFGQWKNLKIVILALVGLTAGQAVVWYTGQFYALFFLTQTLKVDGASANILIAIALLIGTPFFLFFGSLSDRIGRKPIILAGCLIAALTYFPLFKALTHYANPQLELATQKAPISVIADPATCSFQFNPVGTSKFTSSCDIVKSALAKAGLNYENVAAPAGSTAQIKVGDTVIPAYDGKAPDAKAQGAAFDKTLASTLKGAGYPAKADPAQLNWPMTIVILTILVIYVTMVYGPIAAMLVEMFPTRIRYTSMSLPYHIGNGWFGGFLPATAFAIVAAKGNIYSGLWYPIVIALATFVIGLLFVKETKDSNIYAQD
ncbi:sugar (and other) transporter family protein [Burkholderia ambifaria AMMD]|uniref:Major facilitator superfamily MFS_1 n=1 Tax=Burkholderia ambifaria (strain ATCC BAA-244 / DSM 16087 / CCUG 44356 / LMG 19182 / AMMD) TaxID=339670 RepID=Q0BC65_BURCM|nr:MFS transporter [Burkholderia ambifaria]ABI88258.1 major facilitator superfamily MFS_1 [Burkholderia ambifaria AMMD]AJY20705.1 sugar (and other) transporter family protein [Burkholderia ambifaria AMMD]MBR7934295.1 MHS family MFS transporter [Burkholderia ambifaria]PEH64593.1 MFS transporter [Burkholderia ambifaria]QQC04557.1 MHS family MFS transporter [Burkholderia ambifaria]